MDYEVMSTGAKGEGLSKTFFEPSLRGRIWSQKMNYIFITESNFKKQIMFKNKLYAPIFLPLGPENIEKFFGANWF